MKLEEIRSIAESWGVHPSKLSKTQSLKSIQTEEGNSLLLCRSLQRARRGPF